MFVSSNNRLFKWLVFVVFVCLTVVCGNAADKTAAQKDEKIEGTISPEERYKKLFNEHRASQLNAVKTITGFGNYEQKYKLVEIMLKQLFAVLHDARMNVTQYNFLPGDPFPDNKTIQHAVSKVLENTALFGDLVLRLPDIVHEMYDKQRDWQLTLQWGTGFCNESRIFEGANAMLLNLMAQEVDLIPKDENFVNPFKAATQKEREMMTMNEEERKKIKKKEKKKKKIKRGPRLSAGHTEL